MKKIIKYFLRKIYLKASQANNEELQRLRNQALNSSLIMGDDCYFSPDAKIQNSQLNRDKIRIGGNTSIMGHLMIFKHGGEITIGENCYVGPDTKIWSAKSITIGDRVLISHNVNIHDNNSHPIDAAERHYDYMHIRKNGFQETIDLKEKEIVIGDDVWIGFNSTILKGVNIGKGSIIGACTLVTHDVPEFSIVVGNPARIIRSVNE